MVRVLCRTIPQLDTIGSILEELMKNDFIKEIGMPLEYSCKMKTLVLFIKPRHVSLINSIEKVFQKCTAGYTVIIIEASKDSSVVAEKKLNKLETDNSVQEREKIAIIPPNETNMCICECAEEIEQLYTVVFIITFANMILSLYIIFDL
jgi:hypothetical protein